MMGRPAFLAVALALAAIPGTSASGTSASGKSHAAPPATARPLAVAPAASAPAAGDAEADVDDIDVAQDQAETATARGELEKCAPLVAAIGVPVAASGETLRLRCRAGHLLAYSPDKRVPLWVAERLTPARFLGPARRESHCVFRRDYSLSSPAHVPALPEDYKASDAQGEHYDRGHLAPAADMAFSVQAMADSCLMSNIAPQVGIGMNRHIWADLEALVRDWTCDRGELDVLTGPVYDDSATRTLGRRAVRIPSAFFKLVYEPAAQKSLAFILPNEAIPKSGVDASTVLAAYRVGLDELEERTGLRVFPELDSHARRRLSTQAAAMWGVVGGCPAQGRAQGDRE